MSRRVGRSESRDSLNSFCRPKTLYVRFRRVVEAKIVSDQVRRRFAQGDFHRLGQRLHAGGQVHPGSENIVDVFLHADHRADNGTGRDSDTAFPGYFRRPVSFAYVTPEQDRRPGDVLGMVGGRFRQAGYRHIGVADGLDAFAPELVDDAVERRENIVEFGNQNGRVGRYRHFGEAHKVEHQHGYLVVSRRRRDAVIFQFLVDRFRHHVEQQVLRPVLFAAQLPFVLFHQLRIGLDHVFEFLDLRDIGAFHHQHRIVGIVIRMVQRDTNRDRQYPAFDLDLDFAGKPPFVFLQFFGIHCRYQV